MIFCVEDDSNIRELVVYTLETTGFQARGFEEGKSFLEALALETPDLILMDIMLPGEDGISLLKRLKNSSKTRDIPVIMVTAKGAEYDKVKGLDLGADDYITKPFNILEVKARIKAIIRRNRRKTPAVQEEPKVIVSGSMRLDIDAKRLYIDEKEIRLTVKEFDILKLLAENPGKIYSREQLLTLIWGTKYPGDARTVDVNVRRLREKIEENPAKPEYVHTKWGMGYYFQG